MKILLVLSFLMTSMFSMSAFAKKQKCYVDYRLGTAGTGFKYLGYVKGLRKKADCKKKASSSSNVLKYAKVLKPKFGNVTAADCKNGGRSVYFDTKVGNKRNTKDGYAKYPVSCQYKNGACKKWANGAFQSGSW